jgi:tripartite-type tricarboxylate transporter receptor subunit TctC
MTRLLTDLRKIRTLSLALLAVAIGPNYARADGSPSYFAGKNVTIVVGASAGGAYDVYGRLLGRYLGKHIPGQPNVIVTNMNGAGSETAAAYIARSAPKDGTFIVATQATQPLDPILQDAVSLSYDPSRVNYLGSAVTDLFLCVVGPNAPTATFDDMFKTPVIMGGNAATGLTGYLPIALNNLLGTKFKVVFGYPSVGETVLAMQKGEIHGMCGMSWASLMSEYADQVKDGKIKIVVQESAKGVPQLDRLGIPLAASYAHDEQQRRILEVINAQEIFARPYFVAPEVPAERLAILRRAFMETWRDPNLLADAAKANLAVAPMPGEDIQSLLQKIYASPPALLQRVKDVVKQK